MYKVSVVMPIYNGERYLKSALKSIINQIGFENIELIIVDDKSTDNTKTILEEYSKNYPNIKTIFLDENTGYPGIPRNIGIKNATSEYIMFIDDDDEYLPEICDRLYNTMISENADICVCNCLHTDDSGSVNQLICSDEYVFGEEIVYFNNGSVCNAIFKKSIILENNIQFYNGTFEDGLFSLEYYLYSKKLVYLKDFVGYHHIIRKDSTSIFSVNRLIKLIKFYDKIVKLLEMNGGENKYDLNRIFKTNITSIIFGAIVIGNKNEIKEVFSVLFDFERKINFKGKLSIVYQFINFFILHGKINVATYICLFISTFRNSDLLINIYRKIFLKFYQKFF